MNTISNYCRFIGKMVNNPKLVEFDATSLCTFTLAINEYRREKNGEKKKTVNFFDFEAWDSGAETINEFCSKGDVIAVNAAARQQKWTNSKGQDRQKVIFRVQNFRIFSGRENA